MTTLITPDGSKKVKKIGGKAKPSKKAVKKKAPAKKKTVRRKRKVTPKKKVVQAEATQPSIADIMEQPAPQEKPIVYPEGFTDKQKNFCENYVVHCNATRAAIDAGYSKDTAYSIGSENLRKPDIRDVINQMLERDRERIRFHKDELVEGLREIWESSPADFQHMGLDGEWTESIGPDHPARRVLKELSSTTSYDKDGNQTSVRNTIKTLDRLAAGKLLAELLGYKAKEEVEHTVTGRLTVDALIDDASDQERKAPVNEKDEG